MLESLESRYLLSTLTVLNLNDSGAGSLRQAILSASSGDTINFAVSGTITLTSGSLSVNQDLTIAGPGSGSLTVSGNSASRVFQVGDVNFSLSGLTVTGGSSSSSGGAMLMNADPSKTLSLANCVFTNNHVSAGNAGAVSITGDGSMNVTGCVFSNNSAAFNGGALDSPGVFLNVNDSTFSGNSSNNGAAISIGNDSVSVANSTFVGNTAGMHGGAFVSVFNADYTLTNCTITGNSAGTDGGGISLIGGSYTLLNTIVAGNTSPTGPDVSGSVNSQGKNLIGITDGSSGWIGTDFTGTGASPLNPHLGTLGNYGGPTRTVPLLQGSLALGNGATTGAPGTDQRGDPRTGSVDIGAAQLLDAVVTTTADSGPGSLRQAILDTNAHPGDDYITFDIPGGGAHLITPTTPLPAVTDTVFIDGYSQPGSSPNTLPAADNAVLNVVIDGSGLNANALVLNGVSNSVVRGLSIVKFGNGTTEVGGIEITGTSATNNVISGNFLGVIYDGGSPGPNTDGVIITGGASSNTVGGTSPADRNVISGNIHHGLIIEGNSNTVAGNLIGLDATGVTALGNNTGVVIDQGASGNVIGGTTPGARNYIAGNNRHGVKLTIVAGNDNITSGPDATGNVIEGNWIGLNVNGAAAGGQSVGGVVVNSVSGNLIGVAGVGNVISGNTGPGVSIGGSGAVGNSVQGNLIGTDPSGNNALPLGGDGITIDSGAGGNTVGGPGSGAGNVISGNLGNGVTIGGGAGSNNVIQGNLIGTNAAGTAALGNNGQGIEVDGGDATLIGGVGAGAGNVISGNAFDGVVDYSPGSLTIQGNIIGLNAAGNAPVANGAHGVQTFSSGNVLIGADDTPGGRNVISGNALHGIALNGSFAYIVGNYIGTDVTGSRAIGNGGSGIGLNGSTNNNIGDTGPFGGNVISGNGDSGIEFYNGSAGNFVVHNLIGTAAGGVSPLGNGQQGIHFIHDSESADSSLNLIGTLSALCGNVIAFNPVGIRMDGGTQNSISGNSIFGNRGPGILLAPGANDSLAAPTLTAVGTSSVSGFLVALPDRSYSIEIYTTPAGGAAGQGKTLVGVVGVTTDANGVANFTASTASLAPGLVVSATADDVSPGPTARDTSQFSQFLAVPLPLAAFRITPTTITTTAGQFAGFRVTALDANGAVLTTYQGTVAFASVGTDSSPTLPAQYGFTAADAGSHTFSVRYTIAGPQTVGVFDVTNLAQGTAAVLVNPGAFDHLTIGGLSPTTPVGVQNSVTVLAVDAFGNVVSGFNDPLHFTSNDRFAQLPRDATLVNGVGTFPVTFRGLLPTTIVNGQPARIYSVTVTDQTNHTVTASQTVTLPLYLLPAPVQFIAVENKAFTNQVVATFLSDLANGPALSAGDFTATIDWGDGSPVDKGTIRLLPDGSTFAVYGDHQYPTGQTDYPVNVTISFVPTGSSSGFSSQPVTPSVAAVLTAAQFALLGDSSVVRAVGGQTSLAVTTSGADANLTGANSNLNTTLFVANYNDDPVPGSTVQGVSYYDVRATNTAAGATLTVTFRFNAGSGISTLEYYDPTTGQYEPVVGSAMIPAVVTNGGRTITITFDQTSFPRLSSLQGSVFTIVISPVTITQTTTITPAVSLALPNGAGLATARQVSFQASGISVGLTPSEDVARSAGRADLSGGGGDDQPSDDELDLILRILGFGPTDPTTGIAPVAAPPAKDSRPGAGTVGPGAWLPVPAPADVAAMPADTLFAAAAEEPFAFLPLATGHTSSPYASHGRPLLAGSPERGSGDPCLLAIPLLGAVAMQPPVQNRKKKQRRAGVTCGR